MKISPILVEYINHMGSDKSVVDAARVSFSKISENYTDEQNAKLINYLASHNHWTPMSHPQVSFRIKAPIFVARQWFKHMVGITRNEQSRRYVDSEPEFYFPEVWRGRPVNAKQGSSGVIVEPMWAQAANEHVKNCLAWYTSAIEAGIAPEQARMVLPQNMHTEWVETASLAAVCRACKLRFDPHAQQETREVAEQIAEIVAPLFPVSWSALMNTKEN